MALRDQPYLPLYVQDFLTDEKLMECSASATGVYIRIMCVMHKSDPYGTILLRQKDKQTGQQITDFATKLARHFPYTLDSILLALEELLNEKCLFIEGDLLVQKRMVKDGELSLTRSKTGSQGGKATKEKHKKFALAKKAANTESEYISIIVGFYEVNQLLNGEAPEEKNEIGMVVLEMLKIWKAQRPGYSEMQDVDYPALLKIAYLIAGRKGWEKHSVSNFRERDVLGSWQKIVSFLDDEKSDKFLKRLTLDGLAIPKNFQKVEEAMKGSDFYKNERIKQMEKDRIDPETYFTE